MCNLDKIIVAAGFESCPKCNKSFNLVTLLLFLSLSLSFALDQTEKDLNKEKLFDVSKLLE